jgi:hypothetical protein
VINKYVISHVSWWEWVPQLGRNEYGLGGPVCLYNDGWYSEIPIDTDEVTYPKNLDNNKIIELVLRIIENKVFSLHNKTLSFKDTVSLTPAIWLDI